ncbi:MAG: MopE-related protein [Myxococcota bacterium]
MGCSDDSTPAPTHSDGGGLSHDGLSDTEGDTPFLSPGDADGAPTPGDGEGDDGPAGVGEFGAACDGNPDCFSGFCVEGEAGFVCTKLCEETCPSGWSCKGVQTGQADVTFLCIPDVERLCAPCAADFQCNGGVCADLEGDGRCVYACEEDADCPEAYECLPLPEGEEPGTWCQPKGGSCDCTPAFDGGHRTCTRENDLGTCYGVETCDPGVGWEGCTAQEPSEEVCDGLDNDCDLLIDDGIVEGEACVNEVEGVGACEGTTVCSGAQGIVCQGPHPEPEACNGKDDDCDGQVDEDFKAADGTFTLVEHCGGCNVSCEGIFPHAESATCAISGESGAPACRVEACEPGFYAATPTACLPVVSSFCLPCVDDASCVVPGDRCLDFGHGSFCAQDCGPDSFHGEGCPDGSACTEISEGVMQCVPQSGTCDCLPSNAGMVRSCAASNDSGTCFGDQTCDPLAGWSACSAAEPSAEVCDGLDNDCDGLQDEDVSAPEEACETSWTDPDTGEVSTCTGDWACLPSGPGEAAWSCQAPQAGPEACDFIDNDCDGETDEDFRDEAGAYVHDDHCGVCGYSCEGVLPNATARCDGGGGTPVCVVEECDPGFYQVSANTCLPVSDPSCQPCASDAGCVVPGNRCVELGGGDFCARDCSAGNLYGTPEGQCPDGFTCTDVGDGALQCLPDSGACTCRLPEHAGKTRSCIVSNDVGTCTGLEACDPATGWSACDALVPSGETCNGVDDDCDGEVDEGVSPPAEPCEVTNDQGTCTGEWTCDGAAGWTCPARTPAAEECNQVDDDCDGEVDEAFRDAEGRYVDDGNCGVCGFDCEGAVLFATETTCSVEGDKAICVALACEEGYFIPATTNQVCVPTAGGVECSPCSEQSHCNALPEGLCEPIGDGMFCTSGCATTADCPDGFSCRDGRCKPASGSCSCLPQHAGDTRGCFVGNDFGTCSGLQTCDPDQDPGWSTCTAKVPAAEVCDGADNNCNNLVDEGVAMDPPECASNNEFGTCDGLWVCEGEDGFTCSARQPAAEACNFLDDDCDGETDEDFRDPDTGLYDTVQHCGVCNYSCQGQVSDAATMRCDTDKPTPTCVVETCEAGFFRAGDFSCVPVTDDSCDACQTDADCPTPGDRCLFLDGRKVCGRDCSPGNLHGTAAGECPTGFECRVTGTGPEQCVPLSGSCDCLAAHDGESRTCTVSTTFGTCSGTETCDPAQGWIGCTAGTPGPEVCNGLDDDCNGVVDDGVSPPPDPCAQDNDFGSCPGSWVCGDPGGAGVSWWCNAPTPEEEVCNFADDDCDGLVDEPFRVDGTGAYDHIDHCGACGVGCTGTIPNATATCATGGAQPRCEVASCDPGFYQAGPLTCLAATDNTCQPCQTDANCPTPGDRCLSLDGGSFCGRDCSAGNAHGLPAGQCPDGYTCADAGGGDMQCRPTSGSCDCLPGEDGMTRSCVRTSGAGTCFGLETCDPTAGWGDCTAAEPTAEVCDGVDNDCDDLVDDVPGRGDPCEITNGFGTCAGTLGCVLPATDLQCVGPTPAAEACNGVDDDCDGATDEGFDDLFTSCSAGQGQCQRFGVRTCSDDGSGTACDAVPAAPSTEICDNLDNDCDGETDQGFDDKGTVCQVGQGVCARAGIRVCTADGTATTCSAEPGVPGTSDTCDGLDDDCDGQTDEDYPELGSVCQVGEGVCLDTGVVVCRADASGSRCSADPGEPAASDVCDGQDNDCDGQTDEGYRNPSTGKYDAHDACGSCFTDCTEIFAKPDTYGTCDASGTPTCRLTCCSLGDPNPACDGVFDYHDLNGVPDDGCEFQLDPGAIYVSIDDPDASDAAGCGRAPSGTGTGDAPCRTISGGLAEAVASDRGRVLVADGLYVETVTLVNGISLLGGFRADTWERHGSTTLTTIRGTDLEGDHARTVVASGITEPTVFEGFLVEGQDNAVAGGNSYAVYASGSTSALEIRGNTIFAGDGGPGLDRLPAPSGLPGVDGGGRTAANADEYDAHDAYGGGSCSSSANDRQYANGGVRTCGGDDVSGGDGGGNRCAPDAGSEYSGLDGAPGHSGGGGTGGGGGDAGDDGLMNNDLCHLPGSSMTGAIGANGEAGTGGDAGQGCGDAAGAVGDGHWFAAPATSGDGGDHGGGGGGGGAGGGGECGEGCSEDRLGAHGGGGGSGGCGGDGGQPGGNGGGSFGVFIVGGGAPLVADNSIFRGLGGDGGKGGEGGAGGGGGSGGAGGNCPGNCWCFADGGKGGEGGDGGHGGGGGGGCGGPSFGIFTAGAASAGYCDDQGNSVTGGAPGSAGSGGSSLGTPGTNGVQGAFAACGSD